MQWVVEEDLPAYAARVLPWLERDPVRNTVQATVLMSRLDGTIDAVEPWLAWLADDAGAVSGVALRTPPRGMLVSPLPPGAAAAMAAVAEPRLPGAAGPPPEVAEFCTAYAARHGARASLGMRQRLFRLDDLVPPPPPPGRLRRAAGADDVALCARWYREFGAEIGVLPSDDAVEATRRVIAQDRLRLWDDGREPVSMVGHTPPVVGIPRVGPVWTPPAHRRRGYAAATTAGVCALLRQRGAPAVVLFADLANPTSTGVYRRIGFRPVGDHDDWTLEY